MLTKQFFETTRGRLVALLRRGGLTIDEMAGELGITPAAIRAQITAMQRDGLVRRGGQRRGSTRPPHVYEITEDVEQLLSRAYIPLMTQVLDAVSANLSGSEVETVMRRAGKAVAGELMRGKRPIGNLSARLQCADERRARCSHARRPQRQLSNRRSGMSSRGTDGKASCCVSGRRISAAGGGRRPGVRVLRSDWTAALLLRVRRRRSAAPSVIALCCALVFPLALPLRPCLQ